MTLLLCFSGQIGSGKSSVSSAVAGALGWPRAGFGDYLRAEISRSGGDPSDRAALQELGVRQVETDAAGFCRAVLASGGVQPGEDGVIDGIRHVDIFGLLEAEVVPTVAKLLFLQTAASTRRNRVESRGDGDDFERAENHQVEAELRDALPERADALIDASRPLQDVIAECLEHVRKWQQDSSL